jgi:hypothetical protein
VAFSVQLSRGVLSLYGGQEISRVTKAAPPLLLPRITRWGLSCDSAEIIKHQHLRRDSHSRIIIALRIDICIVNMCFVDELPFLGPSQASPEIARLGQDPFAE